MRVITALAVVALTWPIGSAAYGLECSESRPILDQIAATREPAVGEAAALEDAKCAVRAVLKDPDSAQFRNLEFYKAPDSEFMNLGFVCGEVNSRNSFGGYGGFQRFVAPPSSRELGRWGSVIFQEEFPDGGFERVWMNFCPPAG